MVNRDYIMSHRKPNKTDTGFSYWIYVNKKDFFPKVFERIDNQWKRINQMREPKKWDE